MKYSWLLYIVLVLGSLKCFGQAAPPVGRDIPLVAPGFEVRERFDLRGEALAEVVRHEPALAGVRAVTILRLGPPPAPPDEIAGKPRDPMAFYQRELTQRNWKPFWRRGPAPPAPLEAIYLAPDGDGIFTVRVMPRPSLGEPPPGRPRPDAMQPPEVVVSLIEGRIEIDRLGELEIALRGIFHGPGGGPFAPPPPEIRERLDRADALSRQRKWAEAIEEYKAVVKAQPDFPPAYFGLGMAYKQSDDVDAALRNFRGTLELDPLHPGARVEYARLLAFEKKDWEHAIYELRQAASLRRSGPIASELLGRIYHELGRTDEAIQAYQDAERLGPPHPEALLDLGSLYEKKNQREKARAAYERALRAKPDFAPAKKAIERLGE